MNLYDFNRRRLKFTRVLVVWVYILPDVYENSDCFILCYHMIVNFTHSSRFLGFVFRCCLYFCLFDIWNVSFKGACLLCVLGLVSWLWDYFVVQTGLKFLGSIFRSSARLWNSWDDIWMSIIPGFKFFIKFFIIYVSLLHICIPYMCVCILCVLLVFIHMSYNLLNKTLRYEYIEYLAY